MLRGWVASKGDDNDEKYSTDMAKGRDPEAKLVKAVNTTMRIREGSVFAGRCDTAMSIADETAAIAVVAANDAHAAILDNDCLNGTPEVA
jgi:hypothetical protein